MELKHQRFVSGLLALLMVLGGVATVSAAQMPKIGYYDGGSLGLEAAEVFGAGDGSADNPLVLDSENKTLTLVAIDDEIEVTGVYFEGDALGAEPDGVVTLTNGTIFNVTATKEDSSLDALGVYIERFDDAHVTLVGDSLLQVSAAVDGAENEQGVTATGVELSEIPNRETAQVSLINSAIEVSANLINGDDDLSAAEAIGVKYDSVTNAVLTMTAANITATASNDADEVAAKGVVVGGRGNEAASITLTDSSTISAEATGASADVVAISVIDVWDDGDEVSITLGAGTVVESLATGDEASSRAIYLSNIGDASVNATAATITTVIADGSGVSIAIDGSNSSSIDIGLHSATTVEATATNAGQAARVAGVLLQQIAMPNTAQVVMDGDSSIATKVTALEAVTVGIEIASSLHGDVTLTSASIDVVAHGDGDGFEGETVGAAAAGVFFDNVSEVDLAITDTTINSTVTADGDTVEIIPLEAIITAGVAATNYDDADISLVGTDIIVEATATGTTSANAGAVSIKTAIDGVRVGGVVGDVAGRTQLTLQGATIDVDAKAIATAAEGDAKVLATGIHLQQTKAGDVDESTPMVQLTNTVVDVRTTAVAAGSSGVSSYSAAYGVVAEDCDEARTFNLTGSTITAEAIAENGVDQSLSVGFYAAGVNDQINLVSSTISAQGSASEGGILAAIYVGEAAVVEINLDVDSQLHGTFAVVNSGLYKARSTVNNHGLIDGRLSVSTLHNYSDGILQATFVPDSEFIYTAATEEVPEPDNTFYFVTSSNATLDAGSTFRIVPLNRLGLEVGASADYALFERQPLGGFDEGTVLDGWVLDDLVLASSTPMLGLAWNEEFSLDGVRLVVTATLLSADEAGLTPNGQGAFDAALEDGLFTWDSSPEEWVPNVSGAFVAGMAQSLGTSYFNIGNRLGALMGMNSGDEVAASNGMWFSARYTDAEQDKRDGIVGFDADTTGLSIGYDREFDDTILGFAYTYGMTNADANDNSADFDMTDNLFSLYGSYDGGAWYSEVILSAGFGAVEGDRKVGVDVYESDYDSDSYNAKVEMGMKLNQQGWQINPLFAMQYSVKEYDSYTETGSGGMALHVKSEDYSTFTAGLGAAVQKEFQRNWGTFTPEFSGTVNYDIENDRIVSTANFVGGSISFVSKGIEPSETSWDLGAALTIASLGEQNVSFRVGYDYSGRQDFEAHSFTGKIRFEF